MKVGNVVVLGYFKKDMGIVVEEMYNPDDLPNPLDKFLVFWFNEGIIEECHRYELVVVKNEF